MERMDPHPNHRANRPTQTTRPARLPGRSARWSRQPGRLDDPLASGPRDLGGLRELFQRPPGEARSQRRVLVIDVDDFGRETLGLILEGDGYSVLRAANAGESLRLLAREVPPDLIVLDLMLPDLDGRRFLQRLRRSPALRTIPVLVVSAANDFTLGEKEDHVVGRFEKPVEVEALRAAIRQLLPD